MVKSVTFRKQRNEFQKKLKQDIALINSTPTTLTFADKTSNLYKLPKEEYHQLLNNAVTSTYKKVNENVNHQINLCGKKIMKNKAVFNRMLVNGKDEAFITLKDHKPNFQNNPKVRLINPAKNEIGRISKVILDKINNTIKSTLGVNQWKNTAEVIQWFKAIPDKKSHKFIMYDIKDFYPSITESLLKEAIDFAKTNTTITPDDEKIIRHARKSLLFHNQKTWMKSNGTLFDVTMGAYDGAEVCELVGIFLQYKIGEHYNIQNFGLYRDDGLSVFKNISGPASERTKKHLQSIFKKYNLEIVIECNKKIVDYLDVTFNLANGTFKPYNKPDNPLQYINVSSNHPPNIIKQIPKTIEKRLSDHSSNETMFNNAKAPYEKALKDSGYRNPKLEYNPTKQHQQQQKRRRKRNIIWFNPPYNTLTTTKIGKRFLQLIDKHFPKKHKFSKIFNRNTVKVSYSCTKNLKNIIQSHNKKIITNNNISSINEANCNCRDKTSCPLNGMCLIERTIYEATVTQSSDPTYKKVYIGLAEPPFKKRYSNHKLSFSNKKYEKETELSKEIWKIKNTNIIPTITWRTIRQCAPFDRTAQKCNLCLNEKLEIATYPRPGELLNSRDELISKCRHVNKFTLKNFNIDTKD